MFSFILFGFVFAFIVYVMVGMALVAALRKSEDITAWIVAVILTVVLIGMLSGVYGLLQPVILPKG